MEVQYLPGPYGIRALSPYHCGGLNGPMTDTGSESAGPTYLPSTNNLYAIVGGTASKML